MATDIAPLGMDPRLVGLCAVFIVVLGTWGGVQWWPDARTAPSNQSGGPVDAAIELRYLGPNHDRHYRLYAPEPTTDAMGAVRTAYRLESSPSLTGPPEQVEWIDGNLRYVKTMVPCSWDSRHADPCGAAEFYWQSVGRDRNELKSAVAAVYSAGIFALQQERLLSMPTYEASVKMVDGQTVLHTETRDGHTTFTYGSSRYWPDVVELRSDGESHRWVLDDQRTRELPGVPETWPRSPLPDQLRDERLIFPGSDLDFLGSGTSIQKHYDALREHEAAGRILEEGGCIRQASHYLTGDRDPRPVHGALTPQVTTTKFELVSSEGHRSKWIVTSANRTVEGKSDAVVESDGNKPPVNAETCTQQKDQPWSEVPTHDMHRWVTELGSVSRARTSVGYMFGENRGAEEWSERVEFSFVPNEPDGSPAASVARPNSFAFELADGGALLHAYADKPTHVPFLDGGFAHPVR